MFIFFFKQKTAYEMRISDWSSDVCSSDLWRRWFDSEATTLRLRAITASGPYGADIRFASGLNVIWADNTKGKSTCMQAMLYALGLEKMLSRSEERRWGKGVSERVELGGRRLIKKKRRKQLVNEQ